MADSHSSIREGESEAEGDTKRGTLSLVSRKGMVEKGTSLRMRKKKTQRLLSRGRGLRLYQKKIPRYLPESLLDYSTKYFTKYVTERDLKHSVIQGNSVPDSLIIS